MPPERDESTCDECGGPNFAWSVDHLTWYEGTGVPTGEAGGILCPGCFVAKWNERQGGAVVWELRASERSSRLRPFDTRYREARAAGWTPTPFSEASLHRPPVPPKETCP